MATLGALFSVILAGACMRGGVLGIFWWLCPGPGGALGKMGLGIIFNY